MDIGQHIIQISTPAPPVADLEDITRQVEAIVAESAAGGPVWLVSMPRVPLQGL